jgi:anti-anti-sigma regulatory factor
MTTAYTGFSISVTEGDNQVLVRLAGDLDENCSGLVALWLTPFVILTPGRPVVLDLTELTAVHRTGLETLADLVELAAYRHFSLEFVTG